LVPKKGKGPTPRRIRIKLAVIPEPEPDSRTIYQALDPGQGTVLVTGGLNPPRVTLECGNCGAPLVEGLKTSQLHNLVFLCNACGFYNETVE
jgi:hypothetical protein